MSSISGIGGGFSGATGVRDIMALRQQIIERSQVLQQVHAPQQASASSGASTGATSFGDVVQSAVSKVNASQNQAEQLTNAYETGQTQDIAKVMLARQEASVGFEATLQVRNKLLSAYSDIMKFGV